MIKGVKCLLLWLQTSGSTGLSVLTVISTSLIETLRLHRLKLVKNKTLPRVGVLSCLTSWWSISYTLYWVLHLSYSPSTLLGSTDLQVIFQRPGPSFRVLGSFFPTDLGILLPYVGLVVASTDSVHVFFESGPVLSWSEWTNLAMCFTLRGS